MNTVSGEVLLKETNVGVPRLLIEIYDIGSRKQPAAPVGKAGGKASAKQSQKANGRAQPNQFGDRLGSGMTGLDGSFEIKYEDVNPPQPNRKAQRPNLLLIVRSPEEMNVASTANILHLSNDIRRNASATEVYSIHIPHAKLVAAGLSTPTQFAADVDEPEAVIQKVQLNVTRQLKIKEAVQKIAAEQVAAERQRTTEIETAVETRLREKLTGIPETLSERLNFVPAGANVEKAMFRTMNKSIKEKINTNSRAKGYVVLTEQQAELFKDANGEFRDDISAEELAPFLYGATEDSKRPTFLLRENPALAAPPAAGPVFSEPSTVSIAAPGGNGASAGSSTSAIVATTSSAAGRSGPNGDASLTITPDTIPTFVDRLVGSMTSPEEAVAFGVKPRTNQVTVDSDIGAFQLHSGPADVPAFYDFYSLQIAFDYVWQRSIDEGVIEDTKTLSREILDMGGDPIGAMQSESNPINALRKELRVVQIALAASSLDTTFETVNRGSLSRQKLDEFGLDPAPGIKEPPTVSRPPGPPVAGGVKPTTLPGSEPALAGEQRFLHELLSQIESLLNERFAFDVFAAGTVNFGILVTYRQRWAPLAYQAGSLVSTRTLTPKETCRLNVKRVVKRERNVKEMENSLHIRKEDSSNTARDEAEIVKKAEAKTNFSLTAQGSYNLGFADGDSTTVFGKDAATNSSDTKKAFREAVFKAAQEYKDERKLEVETKETYETEVTESTEITNPNDELAVTYLFYELQRRYHISEHIHRLTPVVLVAMEVPNPSRRSIDELLLTYGWIIERVLLDDQFRKPLEYFRTRLVGEEFALTTMNQELVAMRSVVAELKKSYTQARRRTNTLADLLTAQIVVKAQATDAAESEGFWEKAVETFTGDGNDTSVEAARILEDAARERYERAVNQERELRSQLDSETAGLKAASDAYAKALAEYLNCLTDLGTLRLHIKENILYYMQAIWSHTFRDQLFFALHKKKAPRLAPRKQSYKLSEPDEPTTVPAKAGQVVLEVEAIVELEDDLKADDEDDFVTLAEVADLDTLLGFKGNYAIFPLRVSNALTDFMMTPFVDSELGLRDPDELGNFTPEEFVAHGRRLIAEMRQQLEKGEIQQAELDAAIERLEEQFRRLLSAPRRAEDEITVPTGSLYIEALPAAHPILEDFKLMHRAIDVKKVQAEVRKIEMENIRYAARIVSGERGDPEVEKKIIVEGGQVPVLDS